MLTWMTSRDPVLYWSDRVGRNYVIFKIPKFRTMRVEAPAVASHLLSDASAWLTPIGDSCENPVLMNSPALEYLETRHEFCRPAPGAL